MTVVGKSIPHDSAVGHVTGQARYIEDLPALEGELWVDFAGTTVAAGRILAIDSAEASAMPGVVGIYTHRDINGKKIFGPIFHDETFLAEEQIDHLNQPVVVVAATSRAIARQAAKSIRIECEEATPILEIEESIAAGSFLGPLRQIERGEVALGFSQSDHVIEGTFRSNGQEQFYFES